MAKAAKSPKPEVKEGAKGAPDGKPPAKPPESKPPAEPPTESATSPAPAEAAPRPRKAGKGISLEKWLCWVSLAVGAVLAVLFLLDLVAKFPFGGNSAALNIVGFLAGVLIAYLAWDTSREL